MTTVQDNLAKARSLIDSALAAASGNWVSKTWTAISAALKLGAAVALALLEIAGDVKEIRRLCEDGARCDGCGCQGGDALVEN